MAFFGLPSRLVDFGLSEFQVYALFFLLGSFTVASLSDLKHLSAQREFVEVWGALALVLLGLELWDLDFDPDLAFWIKWGLIVALSVLSLERVGVLFSLAVGDVLACAAAASLLSPLLVLFFFVVLKLASWPLGPLLARGRSHYPFMPIVTFATIAVLVLGLWQSG